LFKERAVGAVGEESNVSLEEQEEVTISYKIGKVEQEKGSVR